MPYIQVKRGKPTMYQSGEHEFVCQGLGQRCIGMTMAGAYTKWKNMVELAKLPSSEADRIIAKLNRRVA